jgi:hypothetical protein
MNAKQNSVWGEMVSKAWRDEAFKNRLLSDPTAVLKEHGLELPPGVQIRVVEDTEKVIHLPLPRKPATEAEISEEALEQVAGGAAPSADECPPTGIFCVTSGLTPFCSGRRA